MRFQEQRIPSTAFSQHLQSQDQLIRENLNFAGQTNRRMKEDIQAARRKLNSSSSTGLIRNNAFFQHTENNRNLVNVHQRPNRSNNFSDNLTPQYNTQSQFFRKVGPEVPEEADEEFEVLRREIVETRKQNEGLRQVIAQNDASARFAISQLQNTIDAVRAENQKIKISYELLSKQSNDQRGNKNSTAPEGACSKCQKMEGRIKELEDQLAESNQQLDRELKKRAEANQTNSTFRTQLSERLRSMEEKLLKSNEEILKYESLNFELTRKVSESQQREFYFTEQLNTLSQQLANTTEIKTRISFDFQRIKTENERLRIESETVEKRYLQTINQVAYLSTKVEAINAEIIGSQDRGKADLTVGLGELQERVGELRYQLEEKTTENREYEIRIVEKDASMKKLSEEYGQSLEKIEQLEQALAHYRQNNEELQAELSRIRTQESPASQEQIATQQRWEEAIHAEYTKVQNLNQQLQQKDETVNSLRLQLQEIHNYVHTVTINSQKTVQELNLTITHLYQQNQAVQRKNQELEAIVSRSKQEINQNSFDIVREREEILATREEIQRKTQAYEEALQEINYQQERNIDLEENIYALKAQLNNSQASINDVEQRLASSEAQRWRLESFITELNIKVRKYQEQNTFFVTELNEYRHRVHILEQEIVVTKRIIEEKQEIILKKDREIKNVMISQNNQKVSSGQDQQNAERFYEKKLFQAETYIEQMHQTASIQQQALTQQNQQIEALKGDNLRYKQIIDEITVNQTRITEQISRNEVVRRSLEDKLSQLQPLLRQQSQKNSKAQQTIEIQHEEIVRLNGILLSKDSELQLVKKDFTALIDENTELRGHRASVSTNNDYSQMENTYRKKIESLELEFNGWTQQLNNNLQIKQDEINKLTSELTLLRSQSSLQAGNTQENNAYEDKLFKAERYIEELMHININYEQTQQERQHQIVILQEKLRNIEPLVSELQNDNKNLREIVSKAEGVARTQPSTSDIAVLENRIKQSEQRLNSEITEGTKLKQAIEILSDQLRQQKAAATIISNESKTNQEKAVFFEQKLGDAETFISQLIEKEKEYIVIIDNHEKARQNDGLRITSLSEQLQGALRHIQELTFSLDAAKKEAFDRARQNENVNKQIILLKQQIINIQNQKTSNDPSKTGQAISIDKPVEDFRERLEAAEAHIHYLQNELGSHLNTIQLLQKEVDGFKAKALENEANQKQISNFIADLQGAHKHIEQLTMYLRTKDDEISYLTSIIQKTESQLHNQPQADQSINQAIQSYKIQLVQANQQIQALHEAEVSREQALTNLTQQNEVLRRQLSQHQQALTNFKSQNSNLLKELANAETAITAQKTSKDFLASKLEEAQTHIRYLEQKLPSEHLLTIEKLQKYMDEAEQKAKQNEAHGQEQISSLTFQLHNIQQQLNELENVKNQLEQLYHQTLHERDVNNQALVQKQAQIESLQKLISEHQRGADSSANSKISQLQILVQNNANQAVNFENKLYEAEAYIQQLLAKEQLYVKLEAENNDIKGHLSNLEQALLKSQTDNQNLANRLTKAEETIQSSTKPALNQPTNDKSAENEALLRELKTISEEKEFFRIKLLDAEEHIHYLTHQLPNQHLVTITNLQKHLEEAESKVIACENNVQKSGKQSQAQKELFAQSLQAAQRRVRELEVQKANYVDKLAKLQPLMSEKDKLEGENNTLKQQNSNLLLQISKLQDELNLSQRLSSTQSESLKQYEQSIDNFSQQNKRLKQALAFAEEQLGKLSQIQSITEERLRSRELDIINLSSKLDKDQTNTSAAANEEAEFFKNKLIEAQAYLVELEDRNALSQGIIAQKDQELQVVSGKIVQAEDAIKTAENRNSLLTQEIENLKKLNEQLRENAKNVVPKAEVSSLETRLKQSQQKLQSEITESNKLRKAIETLSEQLRQQKTLTAKTTIEIQVLQDKSVFLQNKILQAENYIGQLQKKENAKEDKNKNDEDNKKQTEQLKTIIDNLKIENERLLGEVKAIADEREFFKGKLNDAEAHINYLQNELVPVVEASKKELAAVKEAAVINEKRSAGEIASLSLQLQGATHHIKEITAQLDTANNEKQAIKKQIVILQQQIIIIQNQKPSNDLSKTGQAVPIDKPDEDFKERLEAAESHIHYLESELESHLNTIQVLHKQVDDFKKKASENEAKQRQISSLTAQLQGASKQIVEITVHLDASKKETFELAKENEAIKKQVKAFELQLSNIQSQKETNQLTKVSEAATAEDSRERLEAAEAHIRYLQNQLGGHLNTIQVLHKEVDDLKKKASENEAKQRQISNLSAQLQGALKHIEQLTDNLQVQEKEVYRLSLALTKAASSPQVEPSTVLQTNTETIESYKTNLGLADQQIKRILEENAAKDQLLSKLQKENTTTKEQLIILNNQLVNSQVQNKVLSDQLAKAVQAAKDQDNASNQDKEFFKHKLADAEEHIAYLENHRIKELENIIQQLQKKINEADRKTKSDAQIEGKSQPQIVALTKRISELQILAGESERLEAEKNALQRQNAEASQKLISLQEDKDTANERANYSENLLMETIKQLEDLKQKMKDAEDYIYNVQTENSKLKETVNASVPSESIYTLPEYVSLEEKVKLLEEQNQRLGQIQEAKASSLQAQVDVKQPVEDAAFFKSKLLEAERYIEEMEHINFVNQQIINQQNDDISNFGAKAAQLEAVNADLVKDKNIISSELKKANDTNNQLKEAVTSLASPEKQVALENSKKQAESKLALKIKEALDITAELNSEKLQNKKKDGQIEALKAEKEASANEAAFFKQKLFDAESYITAIEEVQHSNEDLKNKLKKFVELQDELETLKKTNNTLSKQAEAKSQKIATLEKAAQQLSQQGEFFKRKLLDAETHIKFLEDQMASIGNIDQALDQLASTEQKAKQWQEKAKNFENRNKELALMNHQLLNQLNEPRQTGQIQKLEDSLVQLKSKLLESEANNRELLDQLMEERSENSRTKVTSPDKSDFFKEKLLQAESYINELEEQNGVLSTGIDNLKNQVESLKEECKQREKILVNLEEQINNYAEDLRESEVEKEALQLRNIELEQKIDPLTKKVQILEGQLAREQEISNKEVQNLTKQLETADAKLKEAEMQLQQQIDHVAKLVEEKQATEERADKYENLSSTLQETLNLLDGLHKPFSQQEESIEQLKQQLRAVDKREEDLKTNNAAKDHIINTLQGQIEKENVDNQQLRQKINNLLTQNASLRSESDELNKQLQLLRQVDVPVADNSSLLRNLREEQDKYNQMMRQLEQLTDRIKLTEELNFQMKSLKDIAEKKVRQNETIIRVLEEKVKSEKHIPVEEENNKIERHFMDEKLREAEELITQQQNQINRLTEELIQQQNQSLKYSEDLSSKIEEENSLNNVVKELSNSRRLLDEKIRNLQIENEAIKIEKLEQSKQLEAAEKEIQTVQETISSLLDEKAVADDLAEVSKKELQNLEERYTALLTEATRLKESLQQKEEQIEVLENAQKDRKVDQPVATEQNSNKDQLYQVNINEIQKEKQDLQANNNTLQDQLQQYQEIIATLNGQIVEKESDKLILQSEKERLSKELTSQLSKSSQLEQQKEQSNLQLEQVKERQNGLKSKLDYLEKELENGNNTIEQLLKDKEVSEQKIADLQKAIESLKTEKDKEIQSLLEQVHKSEENIVKITSELEAKNKQIQLLNNEINPLSNEKEQLLKQSGVLQQELQALRADKANANLVQTLTARLSQAEDYIGQLEEEKDNANQIFKNLTTQVTSMKEEVEVLRNELNNSVAEKQRLAEAISELQNEIQMAQSDNQRLTSKVSYLQSVNELKDKEIADLSEFSVNKQQNPSEKSGSKPEGNSNANILPDQNKESNDLEKSKKLQDQQNAIKELEEQIRSLNTELQNKEETIRQLTVENVNINDENKELQERINDHNNDNDEQLRQQLVQADRMNFDLQEENKQLLNDLELLAKDKAYLQGEINQLKAKERLDNSGEEPKTPEKGAKKTSKPVSEPKSEGYNISLLQEEIEQLKQQLAEQRIRGEELLSLEVDNDALKHSKQQLEDKLEKAESERLRLVLKLKDAQEAIVRLQDEYKAEQQNFLKEKSELEENLNIAEKRINKLEEKQHGQGQGQASLGENLKKILDLTKNFNEEIEPEDITQHLQNYPYLNELITSILYRLRLSTALELEKSIKIKQLTEELAEAQKSALQASDLRTANDFLRRDIERLEEQLRDKQTQDQKRYEEVLEELVYYETLNKELQSKMKEISEQYQLQKERLDGYEKQINTPILDISGQSPQDNDLSRENYELRRKLQSSERAIQQFKSAADSSGSINTKDVFYLQFLNTCLDKVVDLQREVQQVERDIEQAAALETSQRNTSSRNEDGKGSDSALQDKLQELEDKLLKNAQNIREHQQRSDNELFQLLKELSEVKELPQFNKNRIDDYLTQLENQILKDHEQHINEVSRLRDQLAASQEQSGRSNESQDEFNKVNKEKLLKEINNLNNTIEIYHQQSMRRKKNYKRTIESLLRDIEKLKERQEALVAEGKTTFDEPLNEAMLEITDKLRYAIQKDEEEDSKQIDLGEDDFIISNNYVQILDGREKDGKNLSGLQENFGEYMEKNVESVQVQTQEDHKPFLSFILSNQNLDKEDIRLLKKKIADMRAKEVQENLQALRAQEKKLEEVLMMSNRENPQQLDNIILTLANNYSRDEISQIFGSEDQDEILNKLNEALCMEDSFYKGQNSSTMMKDIQERMLRHYESPTKLSEQVYTHLINLLSAKKDDEFYDEIQLLFRDLFEIQAGFEQALRKKDELYRVHNERMNQIFNRSSSDGSEEYLTIFQRQNNQDPLQMHSQRKPRTSQHEDEVER